MDEMIKDFTPLFSKEKMMEQQVEVQNDIALMLTLLNSHRLLTEGGIDLYSDKKGYEKVELRDTVGYDLLDSKDLAHFLATTIATMAHEAYDNGDAIIAVADKLNRYDPEDEESGKELEKAWLENKDLIQEMLFLYSEYLYKVFLDNPYRVRPVGIKRDY